MCKGLEDRDGLVDLVLVEEWIPLGLETSHPDGRWDMSQ